MGKSGLYELSAGELKELFKFPDKYGPTDFLVEGDDVYVLSSAWAHLDHFRLDGTYVETIWKFDSLFPQSCLARTAQGGFVVTDRMGGAVYFLNHESE